MSKTLHIITPTATTFQTAVLDASHTTPVLLDFYAQWCGPCKILTPLLEKICAEYNGGFVLAKIDVEKENALAATFQIRSVPTVFLVKDGQVVNGFPGALPEGKLRDFLTQNGVTAQSAATEPEPTSQDISDPKELVARLRNEIKTAENPDPLKLELGLALLRCGEHEQACILLDALPVALASDPRVTRAKSRIALLNLRAQAPDLSQVQSQLQASPDDLQAHHFLGVHLLLAGENAQALEHFLLVLQQDRNFADGQVRQSMIHAFDVIEDDALVASYRRKMASILF